MAIRIINMMMVKDNDKSYGIHVMMTANRKIYREDIIPRRSRDGVMKGRGGGRNATAMGRGYDGTKER